MAFQKVNADEAPGSGKFLRVKEVFAEVGKSIKFLYIGCSDPRPNQWGHDERDYTFEMGGQAKTLTASGQLDDALQLAIKRGMVYGDAAKITFIRETPTKGNPKRWFDVDPLDAKGQKPVTPNPSAASAPASADEGF